MCHTQHDQTIDTMLNAILTRWARARRPATHPLERLSSALPTPDADARGSDSSLLQSLLRWFPVEGEASAKSRLAGDLSTARAAFEAALQGLPDAAAEELRRSIHRSRSARDLWHLRTWLYTEIAKAHSQWRAEQCITELGALLPRQVSGLVFSKRDIGRPH